ncbi:hypothetical protein Ac2012v2_007990 [Leucoagaricus gongylophorus]
MSDPSYGMDIPAAHPRPRPPKSSTSDAPRESGALRTSVWETVLQLGLGMNPIVADWIFDNQLAEEGETSEVVTMSVCALALCQEKFRRLSGSQCLIRYFSFTCPSQVMTCSMYVCDRRFISTASPPNPFELEQRIAPASTHTLPFD